MRDFVQIEPLAVVEVPDVRACLGFTVPEHQPGESAQKHQHDKTHSGQKKERDVRIKSKGEEQRINASTAKPPVSKSAPVRSHAQCLIQWQ